MSSSTDIRIKRSRSLSPLSRRLRAAVSATLAGAVLTVAISFSSATATPVSAEASTFDDYAATAGLAQDHADVFRLYRAFFDRKPEVKGAKYWVEQYNECTSLLDITSFFGNSTEFANTYGTLSDRDYITVVYANVLDRAPDDKGYQYWLGLLSNGTLNRAELMLYFSLGDEFRRRHPMPSDGVAYSGCTEPPPVTPPTSPDPNVYYANCDAVRDAGAAPIKRGDPGYRAGLDRDDDGIGCED